MSPRRWAAGIALCVSMAACSGAPEAEPSVREATADDASEAAPDPVRGRELIAHFECNRCHDGTGADEEQIERQCVGCHQAIREGTFDAPAQHLRRWNRALHSLNDVPSLAGLGGHLRPEWIAEFLVAPHDVRPGLEATMPRLAIDPLQAADIAAALTETEEPVEESPPRESGPDRRSAGRALLDERGCFSCHAFGGLADGPEPGDQNPAQELAPDLRHTRLRMTRTALARWLRDPRSVRPGTLMPTPSPPLSEGEIEDLTQVLFDAELPETAVTPVPERLPVLERPVRFEEVADEVLSATCWHCHADPDFARGDGGAGNTGGFGFTGRGVNLLDYSGISSGYLDEEGERRSLFALDDGSPHLVRVLMARHHEVAGHPVPGVTGMPLGLPPLSLEQIQLVETWIAQGRPN